MGVPFEALLPFGIVVVMFGVSGVGLASAKYLENGGKPPRRTIDAWDRQMMERDFRLTGAFRAQTDNVKAPEGFALNNPWKLENRII